MEYFLNYDATAYLEALATVDYTILENLYFAAGGTPTNPSVDVMITTILSNYNNNQIATCLSSNAGCGINSARLGTNTFPSVIFDLLET